MSISVFCRRKEREKEGRRKGKGKGKERERKAKENRDTRHLALEQASFLEFHYLTTQTPFFSPTNMASIQEAFPSRDLLFQASSVWKTNNLRAP